MKIADTYQESLQKIPPPGAGAGCHPALLGAANRGVMAGVGDAEIFRDLRGAIPPGTRSVPDREIWDTVRRARLDVTIPRTSEARATTSARQRHEVRIDGDKLRQFFIDRGGDVDEYDVVDNPNADHVRLDHEPHLDMVALLQNLYAEDDYLFIGGKFDADKGMVRRVGDWLEFFGKHAGNRALMARFPYIIPNPLTGQAGQTKGGKKTWRGDDCVAQFRFCVAEFDDLAAEEQLAFWRGSGIRLAALIHSGGKSYHAWIAVSCATRDEWEQQVENRLFPSYLVPMGVDPACRNEARLSRLPGVVRPDTTRQQRLLWLSPKGANL